MSVKKDLLAEIDAKAKKIKERKAKTSKKEDIEKLVFDFFKEAELMGKMKQETLIIDAIGQLRRIISQKIDIGVQVEASWSDDRQVQGILITWSKSHQVAYKTEEQLYIGVEDMLFGL